MVKKNESSNISLRITIYEEATIDQNNTTSLLWGNIGVKGECAIGAVGVGYRLRNKSCKQTVIQHGHIRGRMRDIKGQLADNKGRLVAGPGAWA